MTFVRRTTFNSQIIELEPSSPILKGRSLSIIDRNNVSLQVNRLRTNPKNQHKQYQKLALKSIQNNFPISQLKPFASFVSIEKVQQQIRKDEHRFLKTIIQKVQKYKQQQQTSQNQKRQTSYKQEQQKTHPLRASLVQNITQLFLNNKLSQKNKLSLKKLSLNNKFQQRSHNRTFYQKKQKSANKKRIKTMESTAYKNNVDEQQFMVNEYMKDNIHLIKSHNSTFYKLNEKIIQNYPKDFIQKEKQQLNINHKANKSINQKSNTKIDKNTNNIQGLIIRQKQKVEQRYEHQQISMNGIAKKRKKRGKSTKNQNMQFNIFSRSKNRIIKTLNQIESPPTQLENNNINKMQLSVSKRLKFLNQSRTFYKKYMRNSFTNKKITLIQDMKIHII